MDRATAQYIAGPTLSFGAIVRARCSLRDFHATLISEVLIREVLDEAQRAPSNCNTLPWNTHIVSGAKRDELSRALHEPNAVDHLSPDFSWDEKLFAGRLGERRREHGKLYYENLGVMRDDASARRRAGAVNFSFFNAEGGFCAGDSQRLDVPPAIIGADGAGNKAIVVDAPKLLPLLRRCTAAF
ncbi:MAG: nitroreductase family protein [Sulfuricaulis sp.]